MDENERREITKRLDRMGVCTARNAEDQRCYRDTGHEGPHRFPESSRRGEVSSFQAATRHGDER